jgi:hypothetical protein
LQRFSRLHERVVRLEYRYPKPDNEYRWPIISTPNPIISTPNPIISTPTPIISTPSPINQYRGPNYHYLHERVVRLELRRDQRAALVAEAVPAKVEEAQPEIRVHEPRDRHARGLRQPANGNKGTLIACPMWTPERECFFCF